MATLDECFARRANLRAELNCINEEIASAYQNGDQLLVGRMSGLRDLDDDRGHFGTNRQDHRKHIEPAKRREPNLCPLTDLLREPERYWPINDRLLSMLDIGDIIALSRTCNALSGTYRRMRPLYWDVDSQLARYSNNPVRFRDQMRQSNAIISGSFTLQFFGRLDWKDIALDLFVRHSQDEEKLSHFLLDEEEYSIVSQEALSSEGICPFTSIAVLQRTIRNTTSCIKLFSTVNLPIIDALENAYSTATVNIVSWNRAFCFFPEVTYVRKHMYMLQEMTTHFAEHLHGLTSRGWNPSEKLFHTSFAQTEEWIRPRRIGDRGTWTMNLDTSKLCAPTDNDPNFEYSSFDVTRPPRHDVSTAPSFRQMVISADEIKSCVLRHRYACSDWSLRLFMQQKLKLFVTMQLCRMTPESRPPFCLDSHVGRGGLLYAATQRYVDGSAEEFEKPSDWEYVDHLVPKMYQACKGPD